jgi:hypothetical protein
MSHEEMFDDEELWIVERLAHRFLTATNTTSGFWFIILLFLAILGFFIAAFFVMVQSFARWPSVG